MASDIALDAIEKELRHWPGVSHDVQQLSKHRKVVLRYEDNEQFLTIASTGSDSARGHKNSVSDMKKLLKELGAERLDRPIVSKREVELVSERKSKDVKVAITDTSVMLTIPRGSKAYHHFADEKDEGKHYWRFEARSNPNPKGESYFAIVREKAPPEGQRVRGISKGTLNRISDNWKISLAKGTVPDVIFKKFGDEFGATPGRIVSHNAHELLLELAPRKPRQLRGAKKEELERLTAPTPEPEVQPPAPESIAAAQPIDWGAEPNGAQMQERLTRTPEVVAPPAQFVMHPHFEMPKSMTLRPPPEQLSIEKAIDYLNQRKKQLGDKLRFTVEEGGYLSFVHRGGYR